MSAEGPSSWCPSRLQKRRRTRPVVEWAAVVLVRKDGRTLWDLARARGRSLAGNREEHERSILSEGAHTVPVSALVR